MRRRGVSPPLPSPPRGGEARGLRPPLRRGRGRGRSGRIFAAFAAFSRILSPFIAPKARKTPEPTEKNRFSVDPGLFCVYPHTVRLAAASAGLGRSALRPFAAPCAALPPPVPARSSARLRGCRRGGRQQPTNEQRPPRSLRAPLRTSQRPANPSPDRACRAFQRPANPSPRHDITRPTQQNVQVILLRWEKELQSTQKIAGCYSVISDTG